MELIVIVFCFVIDCALALVRATVFAWMVCLVADVFFDRW